MKFLVALLMAVAFSASAQQIDNTVRAPVNVAGALYVGCLSGFAMSLHDKPASREEVKDLVEGFDENCIKWTMIWLQPDYGDLREWSADKIERFNVIRMRAATQFGQELLKLGNFKN